VIQIKNAHLAALSLAVALGACAPGATAPPVLPGPTAAAPAARTAPSTSDDTTKASSTSPRPYARVITEKAKTSAGMFKTHQIDDKLYFEIPAELLGQEMLLVGRITSSRPAPMGGSGFAGDTHVDRTIRWERAGQRVLLYGTSHIIMADSARAVARSVETANHPDVIAAFPVETFGPDSAAVIEVSRLYTSSVPEFQVMRGSVDAKRSFIERVVAFPDNVVVEASQTAPRSGPAGGGAETIVAHWSMVRLPERAMTPRLYDSRIGYYATMRFDFGTDEHQVPVARYIRRYRLEKQDPNAALSEPVQPIVYYVDPATPEQWVPYIKRGVEAWQVAFEAAGFKHAIIAREAPSPEDDPDWSPDDVRNTVVRWLPSTVANAQGPSIIDPRTGEILNGSIRMFHNVISLLRDWYFVQVGPLDARARRLPLPDSLMGRLLEYVVTHEVGHTLGLDHNMAASAMYPADSVRSATWVRRMGHTPSVMDYSRFNYVAQPEDRIPLEDLIPRIGPYDLFAIRWGYAPVPGASAPEAERRALDEWARMQDSVPWYRFSVSGALGTDPGGRVEAVGDADPVRSTELGLRNLRRVVPMLIPATVTPEKDFSELKQLYGRVLGQWQIELGHVVEVVGGVDARERYGSQPGVRFAPLPRARQREAVAFLNEHAFRTPAFLLDAEVLRRLEPYGSLERVGTLQAGLLTTLLDTRRMLRMLEFEAVAAGAGGAYPLTEMLGDVRGGVWSELRAPQVRIDLFRRNLQQAHIEHLAKLAGETSRRSVLARPYLRGELRSLDAEIRAALPRAADRSTRHFLLDAQQTIEKALDPKS
jgi:hypothetical protein